MTDVIDIDDLRPDDYWTKRMLSRNVDELFIYYRDMDEGDVPDARIAYVRFFNLMHRLHKNGLSAEDIFAGGFNALTNKICDLEDCPSLESMCIRHAHDRISGWWPHLCDEKVAEKSKD